MHFNSFFPSSSFSTLPLPHRLPLSVLSLSLSALLTTTGASSFLYSPPYLASPHTTHRGLTHLAFSATVLLFSVAFMPLSLLRLYSFSSAVGCLFFPPWFAFLFYHGLLLSPLWLFYHGSWRSCFGFLNPQLLVSILILVFFCEFHNLKLGMHMYFWF